MSCDGKKNWGWIADGDFNDNDINLSFRRNIGNANFSSYTPNG
jgi:hypothetical protein